MSTRLGQLVESLGGRLIGSPDVLVTGMAALETANSQHITFLSNSKLRAQAEKSAAGALILSESDHLLVSSSYQGARIITANPYATLLEQRNFLSNSIRLQSHLAFMLALSSIAVHA